MRMYDIINHKKIGGALSEEEIRFFVDGFTRSEIPDYQASALLMAICIQGMDEKETAVLPYRRYASFRRYSRLVLDSGRQSR